MAIKLSPEQQKAVEEQKLNCPFCKIVKGEIPAKKVYEDADVQAIMDINPAAKGHMLVMPKEHYPIMPLIPDKSLEHLFVITKDLCATIQDGLLSIGSTVFIANGAAAGQQSQHFLLHIIPRDNNDHLAKLELPQKTVDLKDIDKMQTDLRNNLTIMLRNHFKQMGKPFSGEQSILESMTSERLIALIEANPPILELLLTKTEEFKQLIPKHPQLSVMFKGKDVNAIVDAVLQKHATKKKQLDAEKDKKKEEKPEQATQEKTPPEEKQSHPEKHEPAEKSSDTKKDNNANRESHGAQQEKEKTGEGGKPSIDDIARLFTGK